MSLDDAQDWMDAIHANNPDGDVLANFLKWYSETSAWMEEIERNNPVAESASRPPKQEEARG